MHVANTRCSNAKIVPEFQNTHLFQSFLSGKTARTQHSSMENSPLPAIFVPTECLDEILRHFPRDTLKNLRLKCKAFEGLIVSPRCHLFIRVYVSPFPVDIEVLSLVFQAILALHDVFTKSCGPRPPGA